MNNDLVEIERNLNSTIRLTERIMELLSNGRTEEIEELKALASHINKVAKELRCMINLRRVSRI